LAAAPFRSWGHIIGPISAAQTASHGDQLTQVGAYLRASSATVFTGWPSCELTDRVIAIEDIWGPLAEELELSIREARGDAGRVDSLEAALLKRLACSRATRETLDLAGLAQAVVAMNGNCRVETLADQAGVSRQHLTRTFRERVGVTPKLYCSLVRFRAVMARIGNREFMDWARIALESGYYDQSHMIADFQRFSGFAPTALVRKRLFHPFVEDTGSIE
jgi:AraC-like DNA-binding protein